MGTIRSGALDSLGYDADTAVLTVSFADGGTYEYYGVPRRLYERLLAAQPHPWSALGAEVRRHPFRRVD
ncbi:MAG TPA: KTSC domain-containing protein [Frankiaceae bacterium]|nr:KTSC domain-containing protein [Frankiaceae bacterium]